MVKELERRQKIRQILYSWPSIVLLAFLTFLLVRGALIIVRVERGSAQKVSSLEDEAEKLVIREGELQKDINKLRTEEGVEAEIKQKFSVTQDGEYVAIIVDSRKSATSSEDSGGTWFKRLWSAIMQKL